MGKIRYAYDTASGSEIENKPDTGLAVNPTECDQSPEIRDDVVNQGEGFGRAQLESEAGAERRFYVYYLRRPDKVDPLELRPGCPFYVGKGSNGRHLEHRKEAKSLLHKSGQKFYKIAIIHKLWKQGLDFQEDIVFNNLTEKEAFDIEIQAIEAYGRKDNKTGILANLTDGGEGLSGFSDETIEKLRKASSGKNNHMYGKHHSLESNEKRRQSHLGKKHSPERIENIRRSHLGKKLSPETIEKIRQSRLGKPSWNKGKKHSPETIEKIRQAKLGQIPSPEAIEKTRQANLGREAWNKDKKHKPETIEKIRKTLKDKPWSAARREAENNKRKDR